MILYGSATAFLIMFLLIRKRVPLGLSLVACGSVVGVFCFDGITVWANAFYFAFFSRSTTELTAIILLINLLGYAMKEYGTLDRINIILGRVFPDERYILAFFPAIIGMLSVPGGAILSAPIVDSASRGSGFSPSRKAAINLIFRHFWFLSYPLYTSMIIMHSLSGVRPFDIVKLGIVPTLVCFLVSFKVNFKGFKHKDRKKTAPVQAIEIGKLFYNLAPILTTLTIAIIFRENYVPALIIGILVNEVINRFVLGSSRINLDNIKSVFKSFYQNTLLPSLKWQLAIIPVGINFLRLSLDTAGVPKTLADLLLNLNIPLEALIFIMPLLISFFTGIHLASVSITIPLFLPLLSGQNLVQPMFLLLTAATVGYWMSPFHLCFILNMQYFKANYLETVRLMIWPSLTLAAAGIVMFIATLGLT